MEDPTKDIALALPETELNWVANGEPVTGGLTPGDPSGTINRVPNQLSANQLALAVRLGGVREGFVYLFGLWERVLGLGVDEGGFPTDVPEDRDVVQRLAAVEARDIGVIDEDHAIEDVPSVLVSPESSANFRLYVRFIKAAPSAWSSAVIELEVLRENLASPGVYEVLETLTMPLTARDQQWVIHDAVSSGDYSYTLRAAAGTPFSLLTGTWSLGLKVEGRV